MSFPIGSEHRIKLQASPSLMSTIRAEGHMDHLQSSLSVKDCRCSSDGKCGS